MKKLLLVALFVTFPMAASATLITYNLAGNSGDGAEGLALDGLNIGTVTKGGVSATLSTSPDNTRPNHLLNQTASRFGINVAGDGCDNSALLDGGCAGGPETLVFSISEMVELVSITISSYVSSEIITLDFENPAIADILTLPSSPSTIAIGSMVGGPGDRFLLTSVFGNGVSIDRFTINTTSVPEPASLALFALGLGALGLRKKRA